MDIHFTNSQKKPNQFPQKIKVVSYNRNEEIVDTESREINSLLELNTLLQEVNQFNNDPGKENGIHKTIIR